MMAFLQLTSDGMETEKQNLKNCLTFVHTYTQCIIYTHEQTIPSFDSGRELKLLPNFISLNASHLDIYCCIKNCLHTYQLLLLCLSEP